MTDTVTEPAAETTAPVQPQETQPSQVEGSQSNTVFEDIAEESKKTESESFLDELYNNPDSNPGDKSTGNQTKEPVPDPDDQIPTEYSFDGVSGDVVYTDEDKSLVSDLGKELKLTNRQAKTLLQKGGAVISKYRNAAVEKQLKVWSREIYEDEQLGKEHFSDTKKNCSLALKHYGSDALKKLLLDSKLGNHPDVIRFFNAIGQDLREESSFAQGQAPVKKKSPTAFLDELYANSPSLK